MTSIVSAISHPFSHVSTQAIVTLLGLVVLLLVCSIQLVVAKGYRVDRNDELTARVFTWWLIVVALIFVFGISNTMTIVFLAAVSFFALREYLKLIPAEIKDRDVGLLWIYMSVPIQFYWVWTGWVGMFLVFIPVYMFLFIPSRMVVAGKTEGFLNSLSVTQWGLMTTVFSLSHAAMLLAMPLGEQPNVQPQWFSKSATVNPGLSLLILLLVLTQFNDVAQYCWGKTFGNKKVLPTISPGKTVAGLVGGILSTTVLSAVLAPWLTLLDFSLAVLIGLVVGAAGFLGDVSISAIKRDLGVKDTGTILPGHGGLLDRLDSLTFTAPLFFHIVYFCYG